MTNIEKQNVILIYNSKGKEQIKSKLQWNFNVFCQTNYKCIVNTLRVKQISAIIFWIPCNGDSILNLKEKICSFFPTLPKIAILKDDNDIELIRKCGEVGINHVILLSDINELNKKIKELIQESIIKVTLEEIGITNLNLPELTNKALSFIETHYIQLMSVEEILSYLRISYKTLSTLFNQANIINPKGLIMYFKIRHSLYLLKQGNLSIKEVAYQSGFSNEKRFLECFKRTFNKTPRDSAIEIKNITIEDFWIKNIQYKTQIDN